jgi:threonyl-tRNA synthetase
MSTLQVDLQFPTRFDLEFQASDGTRQRPYMIHRALFGSVERFFAIILEHYAGALPAWLSPVQVTGIPIAERHVPYLEDIAARLSAAGARVEIDTADERMQKKILKAQQAKVPFMLLAGDKDVEAGLVSLRLRDGTEKRVLAIDEAVAEILGAILPPDSTGEELHDGLL